jgi:hypothetical protein
LHGHCVVFCRYTDDRGIRFSTNTKFADQTLDILREQIKKEGKQPIEFIPLPDLKAEVEYLFDLANQGKPYDEVRLDYLLACMDYNPDYKLEKEQEAQRWRDEITPYASQALATQRGFIPPHIFHATWQTLVNEDGFTLKLAKRVFMKKALWLVRISSNDINKMHIAELTGRFNPEAQGLDIIETASIFAAIPPTFKNDPGGKKERWRMSVETSLKSMYSQHKKGKLPANKMRCPDYAGC